MEKRNTERLHWINRTNFIRNIFHFYNISLKWIPMKILIKNRKIVENGRIAPFQWLVTLNQILLLFHYPILSLNQILMENCCRISFIKWNEIDSDPSNGVLNVIRINGWPLKLRYFHFSLDKCFCVTKVLVNNKLPPENPTFPRMSRNNERYSKFDS